MLCNLKTNYRPDKTLQHSLVRLAALVLLLGLCILSIFLLSQHLLYVLGLTIILTVLCFIYTIRTLQSGEAAISYGGFANEIINHSEFAQRIENPDGESVIENEQSQKLIGKQNTLSFIKKYLAEGQSNQSAIYRLENAVANLCSETTKVSLLFNHRSSRIFNELEYFEITVTPIYLKKPKIFNGAYSVKRIKRETYLHWQLRNITAQHSIDRVLHDELNGLHDFLDQLPLGLYSIDSNATLTYINNDMADFLQLPREQLIGHSISDFTIPADAIPLKNEHWFGQISFRKSANEVADAYVFQTGYRQNEKTYLRGAVVHQIPSLDNSPQNIKQIFDNINHLFKEFPIGVIYIDNNGNLLDYNLAAAKFLTLNNDSSYNIFKLLDNANSAKLQTAVSNLNNSSKFCNIDFEHNDYILNFNLHSLPYQNSNNFIIYITDISKQKKLETQFAQAQKMQAIGQFAGGVAHDFNNLLTAIIGFTDLLLQRHGIGDPAFADLIQIKQNANRATSLVRQLLAFSRKQPLIPKFIDITENFADLNQMLKRIIGEKIKLLFHHGMDLGYVKVDPNQFAQVIINLAVNAKDAMNGEGTLTISTSAYQLKDDYAFGDDIIPAGNFVKIDVQDTGCGIPPENLHRIFDPFFSTKENIIGSGTGLGLAMVYGIVRQTEGFLKVASTVGEGTTFSIFLPRYDHSPEEISSVPNNNEITNNSGQPILKVQETLSAPANINQKIIMGLNVNHTIDRNNFAVEKSGRPAKILFVEDEKAVRTFAVRALRKKGYQVTDSDSAENALEILQKDHDFDLLLTDMVLPNMSGAQLTNQVKKQFPAMPVILASGYSEDIAKKEVDNTYQFNFITKPYSLDDLTAKVFDVLNSNHD